MKRPSKKEFISAGIDERTFETINRLFFVVDYRPNRHLFPALVADMNADLYFAVKEENSKVFEFDSTRVKVLLRILCKMLNATCHTEYNRNGIVDIITLPNQRKLELSLKNGLEIYHE